MEFSRFLQIFLYPRNLNHAGSLPFLCTKYPSPMHKISEFTESDQVKEYLATELQE